MILWSHKRFSKGKPGERDGEASEVGATLARQAAREATCQKGTKKWPGTVTTPRMVYRGQNLKVTPLCKIDKFM